ncbi:MAG: uncharacterized protein JWM00_796 [Candidatus Saccharibacteria bacterium]|nr:uncharacterized protein [Candidatus Saccharibacteria bacterium]
MTTRYRTRRLIGIVLVLLVTGATIISNPQLYESETPATQQAAGDSSAVAALASLPVKGKAPKSGYSRSQFGDGWATATGCDTRNIILHRDLQQSLVGEGCKILSGTLHDPYTGRDIAFMRGEESSQLVQIDHVVALSNAWQTGAQQLASDQRTAFANDPLNLLAVEGAANQQKSDGDAATWLPSNKAFRCQYVARQIAVKQKYTLWVVVAEKAAIERILDTCPSQSLPR